MSRDTSGYVVNGRRLVSVTEAIGGAGLSNLDGIDHDVLEAKRQLGSDVHEWLDAFDSGRLTHVAPPNRIAGYVHAWLSFREASRVEIDVSGVERALTHLGFGYAGTPDRVGFVEGAPAVVEIKTTYALAPWVALQLAGYDLLVPEKEERRRIAVRLGNDGSYQLKEYRETRDADTRAFLGAVAVAQWRRAQRDEFEAPSEDG